MSRNAAENKHALIIGGGLAGLLAARVAVDHFTQVTLIERDHYPEHPVSRPGVPQSRQLHFLPLRGQRTMERFFPGLGAKLLAQGAVERTYGAEGPEASIIYYYDQRCPPIPPLWHGWNCSRSLLEWQIRQELSSFAQLQIMEGYEVVHLLAEPAHHSVCGVQYRARTHTLNTLQDLRADLVIDASGASSHVVTWLAESGYPAPVESQSEAWVCYATRIYQPAADAPWKEIAIQMKPPRRHGGLLMGIEEGKWMIVLSSTGKEDLPPTEDDQFLDFARHLADASLYEAIQSATPLSPIYGYRKKANYLRRFHKQPEGLLIMGDALCSFNPVYGQGMTIAALEAVLLDTCLRRRRKTGLARTFQKKATRLVMPYWNLAATADAVEQTNGFAKRYMEGLSALLTRDVQTLITFLAVQQMLQPPLALFHPAILAKMLWYACVSRYRTSARGRP